MKIKKMFPNKFMWVVFGVTFGLLALSVNLWSEPRFSVSFQTNLQKDTLYQVFYTRKATDSFNEKMSVKQLVNAGQHEVEIDLPIHKLAKFRLDFGNSPGKVEISDLKIDGRSVVLFDDFSKFSFRNITKPKMEKNKLSFDCAHRDPYIVYKDKLTLKGGRSVDFYALIILATLYFLIAYKVVRYLSRFKIEEHHSRIDIVFLAVFFALLFVPMMHISDAEKSTQENRMLAKKPDFSQIYDKGGNFGKLYEQWFNDRFFGRKALIELYDEIMGILTRNGNKKVLIGENGWLFFKGDNSLRNFQNLDVFAEKDLKKIAKYLGDIQNWAEKNHKQFYFLIGPDKNKIYGENIHILKQVNGNDKSRANQLIKYLKAHTKVKVVYPYNELHQAKKNGLLYWKNDTHWNDMGAFIAYQTLFDVMAQDFDIDMVKYTSVVKKKKERGDLSNMFSAMKNDKVTEYLLPQIQDKSKCNNAVGAEVDVKCINSQKTYRVYVFRDSFASALAPYLNNTFNSVSYFWRKKIEKGDLSNLKQNADIIILETVERKLSMLADLQFPKE